MPRLAIALRDSTRNRWVGSRKRCVEPSPASASAMTKANSGLELGKSAQQVRDKQRNPGHAEARGLRLTDRNRRHLPRWLWSVGRRPITDQTNPAATSISQYSFAGR